MIYFPIILSWRCLNDQTCWFVICTSAILCNTEIYITTNLKSKHFPLNFYDVHVYLMAVNQSLQSVNHIYLLLVIYTGIDIYHWQTFKFKCSWWIVLFTSFLMYMVLFIAIKQMWMSTINYLDLSILDTHSSKSQLLLFLKLTCRLNFNVQNLLDVSTQCLNTSAPIIVEYDVCNRFCWYECSQRLFIDLVVWPHSYYIIILKVFFNNNIQVTVVITHYGIEYVIILHPNSCKSGEWLLVNFNKLILHTHSS
jgi:hypothetical protein